MGTDFAYEDLRPESLPAHRYTPVGTEAVEGVDCQVIEAAPATDRQAADTGYSKRKIWIRKDNLVTVKREYYDKQGKLEKVESRRKLVNVTGERLARRARSRCRTSRTARRRCCWSRAAGSTLASRTASSRRLN